MIGERFRREIVVASSTHRARDDVQALVATGSRSASVDLSSFVTSDEFVDELIRTYLIPYRGGGVDGLIDSMVDMDWLPADEGHVLLFTGWDTAEPAVRDDAAITATYVLDGWRGAHPTETFVMAFVCATGRSELLHLLTHYNDKLARHGRLYPTSLTAAVPVVVLD